MEEYKVVMLKGYEYGRSETNELAHRGALGTPSYGEIVKITGDTMEQYYEVIECFG